LERGSFMSSRSGLLFEHDLRAKAFGVCREGKGGVFPDRALVHFRNKPGPKRPGLFLARRTLSDALGGLAKEGRCT